MTETTPWTLLVIDGNPDHEWAKLFADREVLGRKIRVEQGGWAELSCYAWDNICVVDIRPNHHKPIPGGEQLRVGIRPDFVLIREVAHSLGEAGDWRRQLYALKYAGIPSVNSLESVYACLERPWVFSELKRVGLPVVAQRYFSDWRAMTAGVQAPAVLKASHLHAGYGKVKVDSHQQWEDLRSLLALTPFYLTGEPFLNGDYDLRIQRIGKHVRVMSRTTLSGAWKTNTGSAHMEELPVTEQFQQWTDAASKLFGGLDIFALDALVDENGKITILELNDTSIGLSPDPIAKAQDMGYIVDLVVERMGGDTRSEEEKAQSYGSGNAGVAQPRQQAIANKYFGFGSTTKSQSTASSQKNSILTAIGLVSAGVILGHFIRKL